MGLMDLFKKKETLPNVSDENLVAICSGEMIEAKKIKDEMFSKEMLGKTIGFIPTSNEIVAPCNGILEVMFPTGHAFAIRMKDGTGVLVHVGINTVDLDGKGFKTFASQGAKVKAGQKLISVDFDAVKSAGFDITTMVVISEPIENKEYLFYPYGKKEKTEIIL